MLRWLRAFAASPEDLSSVSSTQISGSKLPMIPAPDDLTPSSGFHLHSHTHMSTYMQAYAYTYIQIILKILILKKLNNHSYRYHSNTLMIGHLRNNWFCLLKSFYMFLHSCLPYLALLSSRCFLLFSQANV